MTISHSDPKEYRYAASASQPGRIHTVRRWPSGAIDCTCDAYRFSERGSCRHQKAWDQLPTELKQYELMPSPAPELDWINDPAKADKLAEGMPMDNRRARQRRENP